MSIKKEKTALQQYIDWINSNEYRAAYDRGEWYDIENQEKKFLEMERKQIEDAYLMAQVATIELLPKYETILIKPIDKHVIINDREDCQQYFNETFES